MPVPSGPSRPQGRPLPLTFYCALIPPWPEARVRQGAGPLGHKPEIRAQSHQERQQAQGASEQGQGPAGLHGGGGWASGSWVRNSLVMQIPGSLREEEAMPPGLLGESSSWGSWGTCGLSDQTSLVSPSSWQPTLVTHPPFPAFIGTRPPTP